MKAPLMALIFALLFTSTLAVASDRHFETGLTHERWHVEEYCEDENCPTRFEVHGFDVRVAPVVYDAIGFSYEELGLVLDLVQAQLTYIDPPNRHHGVPREAVNDLRKVVSIYFSHHNWLTEDPWWPCGPDSAGCYSLSNNRIAFHMEFFLEDHLRQPVILHELAHAYHHNFIPDGFDNECVKTGYERSKEKYRRVPKSNYATNRPYHDEIVMQEAWAYRNQMEWFAETTEAYFLFNGEYPFNRYDLWDYDKNGYAINELWYDRHSCPLWRY